MLYYVCIITLFIIYLNIKWLFEFSHQCISVALRFGRRSYYWAGFLAITTDDKITIHIGKGECGLKAALLKKDIIAAQHLKNWTAEYHQLSEGWRKYQLQLFVVVSCWTKEIYSFQSSSVKCSKISVLI